MDSPPAPAPSRSGWSRGLSGYQSFIHRPFVQRPKLDALSHVDRNISVAFCDDFTSDKALSDREAQGLSRHWTHVIRIMYGAEEDVGETRTHYCHEQGIETLTLLIPAPHSGHYWPGGVTVLTDHQLKAARDFLTLSLPNQFKNKNLCLGRQDKPQALITAPRGYWEAVDVMSVVACYQSFVTECSVSWVLRNVRREYWVNRAWKNGAEQIEKFGPSLEVIRNVVLQDPGKAFSFEESD